MNEIIHNPTFWVVASFIGFIAIAMHFKLHIKLAAVLDNRAANIKKELDAARALREEAAAVLADYQQKQAAHLKEAENMLARAKEEADALRANAEKELQATLDTRMKAAMDRIDQQEQQALSDIRDHVVDITIAAAKDMVAKHFDQLSSEEMTQTVLSDLDRKVH